MQEITNLTNYPKQNISIILNDNSILKLNFEYMQGLNSWYISIVKDNFILNNQKLTCSLNILRQFKNIINFGISIITTDGLDPNLLSDFVNNGTNIDIKYFQPRRCRIFILNQVEAQEVEAGFYE